MYVKNEANVMKIVEERAEKMVPHTGGGTPIVRLARFLNPSTLTPNPSPFPSLPKPQPLRVEECLFNVHFRGWRSPQVKWRQWVQQMTPIYGSIWKQTGIYDSIIMSTYQFLKDVELIWGLVDSWCPDTNTFMFPWGEATMSLEDMSVIGSFSVLGEPVTSPLSQHLLQIQDILLKAYKDMQIGNRKVAHCEWIRGFAGKDDELGHIAFLTLWLSRYVFPTYPEETIGVQIFPIAIRLSRGTRIALAPAILASLYSDLRQLKQQLVASETTEGYENDELPLNIWAPFQMMQLWAWERFPSLQPIPNPLKSGEPRAVRWHKVKSTSKFYSVTSSIRLSDDFLWRPYSSVLNNWKRPLYYRDQAEWITLTPDTLKESEELQSFFHFIVPCELVGLECIEQYLPHRVGMQFGMDQDIPGHFCRADKNWETAWVTYNLPIRDLSIYIPPRLFESDVTVSYFDWWKLNYSAKVGDMVKEDSLDHFLDQKSEGSVDLDDESTSYEIPTARLHMSSKDVPSSKIQSSCSTTKRKINVEVPIINFQTEVPKEIIARLHMSSKDVPSSKIQSSCSTTKRKINVEVPIINFQTEVPKEIIVVYEDNDRKTRDPNDILLQRNCPEIMHGTVESVYEDNDWRTRDADILLQTHCPQIMPDTVESQMPGLELEIIPDTVESQMPGSELDIMPDSIMPDTVESLIPGLELETRIYELEKVVDWLTQKFVARKKKKTSSEAASQA